MANKDDHLNCPSCGARVAAGTPNCNLCGMPISEEQDIIVEPIEPVLPASEPMNSDDDAPGPFCNQCGWHNPAGARFCSACGAPLQDLQTKHTPRPPAQKIPPPGRKKPQGKASKRRHPKKHAQHNAPPEKPKVGIMVAAGSLLVVAVYLISVMGSSSQEDGTALQQNAPSQTNAPQFSVEDAQLALELEESIAQLEGAERIAQQRKLVQIFANGGRYDRAAIEQEKIALAENKTHDWVLAGNYFYDWAATVPEDQRAEPSRRAIEAYKKVLEQDPDNLDVRTDLAAVYQWDPTKTEEAIEQTKLVLERNPVHVQANFNMGIFLMRQDRDEEAISYFERVQTLAPVNSPVHQRAGEVIGFIQQHTGVEGI